MRLLEAKVDMNETSVKNLLKESTSKVLESFQAQYAYYKSESEKGNTKSNNIKFRTRELTLFRCAPKLKSANAMCNILFLPQPLRSRLLG